MLLIRDSDNAIIYANVTESNLNNETLYSNIFITRS